MNIKINICPICVVVSLTWLILSAGVAWGYLGGYNLLILISLLMGGTVVGMAYLGEKKCHWAAKHPQKWKMLVILIGMPTAYLLVTNLSKFTVVLEVILLLKIAYLFFIKRATSSGPENLPPDQAAIHDIEEKMEQCC